MAEKEIYKICSKLKDGQIAFVEAQEQLLLLFRVSKRSELLLFLESHYEDVDCNQEQRETIVDQYLKQ